MVVAGFQKGRQATFAHDFALAKSSVLCLFTDWRENVCRRLMGGTHLSDRKTSRDFRANSEKSAACFHKVDGHIALVFRPMH